MIGTRGLGRLTGALLGSVTQKGFCYLITPQEVKGAVSLLIPPPQKVAQQHPIFTPRLKCTQMAQPLHYGITGRPTLNPGQQ